ncbi:transglycosylase domain-containing protein [Candidatus Woesebacteria bacterium]|nr:transglycosylase domain-containing protein [Candidatus Woesebacteria bacterium]
MSNPHNHTPFAHDTHGVNHHNRLKKAHALLLGMPRSKVVILSVVAASFALICVLSIWSVYKFILKDLPSPDKLNNFQSTALSSHIYDRNGELLYEIFDDQNRTAVRLKTLPKYVGQSAIAIEDKDFYKHSGISLLSGVLRAVRDMTVRRQGLQGGSTITQQLVKQALLTPERTVIRKVKEIILAFAVEKKFTKDQILEMYLNQIPYGGSAYGIEEATNMYFGKGAKDLTIAESAFLAGLPQAPSKYSPYANPQLAKSRRNDVLLKMFEQKYITQKQYDQAVKSELSVKPPHISIKAPHFVFYVKNILDEEFGDELVGKGGLNIYTTLDLEIQEQSEKIVQEELEEIKYLNVGNAASLVTRPVTGEILAMVGSADYFASPSGSFNVVTAENRQPGSSIKPINYAIALDQKLITPASVLVDAPTCFSNTVKSYCPGNYEGGFGGPTQIRFALGNSNNIIAVKVMALNTVDTFIASSSAFLIDTFKKDPSRYGLSLTLGGGELPMYELAQAYSAFPNRGKPRKVQSILKITDPQGKVLYQFEDPNYVKDIKSSLPMPNYLAMNGKRAISEDTSYLISHILLDNNARTKAFGPSSELNIKDHAAVSVKTGTTDNKRDNWTIGYTPNFLVAVWVGNNDNTPMNQYLASGVTGAAPIWNKIMTSILKDQPDLWPTKPETVVGRQVCSDGRLQGGDGGDCSDSRFEYFIKGSENVRTATTEKAMVWVNRDTDKQAKEGEENTEQREKTVIKDKFSVYCLDCAH